MTPVTHPLCSLHPAPKDFCFVCLFCSLDEKVLTGKRFAGVEEVRQKMADALKGIEIDEFKHCFEQWKQVLIGTGEYFEGD